MHWSGTPPNRTTSPIGTIESATTRARLTHCAIWELRTGLSDVRCGSSGDDGHALPDEMMSARLGLRGRRGPSLCTHPLSSRVCGGKDRFDVIRRKKFRRRYRAGIQTRKAVHGGLVAMNRAKDSL